MVKVGDTIKIDLEAVVLDIDPETHKVFAKLDDSAETYCIVNPDQYELVIVEPETSGTIVILKNLLVDGQQFAFQKSGIEWYLTGDEEPWVWQDVIENCEIIQIIEPR